MLSSVLEDTAKSLVSIALHHSTSAFYSSYVVNSQRDVNWFKISLATLYIAIAKYYVSKYPNDEIVQTICQRMDEIFFDYVNNTKFVVKITDALITADERFACAKELQILPEDFFNIATDSYSMLSAVYSDRSNQYIKDFARGVDLCQVGHSKLFDPTLFIVKRFNQHLHGIEVNMLSRELETTLLCMSEYMEMFLDLNISISHEFSKYLPKIFLSTND